MPPCSGQSRPSPAGGREDAASLDRPCARRLRELAVGMEEYSRRGSNQRMRPKRARKPTISNRWFSGNFRLALTKGAPAASRDDFLAVLRACWHSHIGEVICQCAPSAVLIVGKGVEAAVGDVVRRDLGH